MLSTKRDWRFELEGLAPRHGFEPRFTAPKAAVLPLDDRGFQEATTHQFSILFPTRRAQPKHSQRSHGQRSRSDTRTCEYNRQAETRRRSAYPREPLGEHAVWTCRRSTEAAPAVPGGAA